MPEIEENGKQEDVSPESDGTGRSPEAIWTYTLSKEEIYQGLRRSSVRRAGPVSDWVRTGILAVVAAGCVAAYFMDDERSAGTLVIAVLAAALIAVLWITPPLRCRHVARQMAEGGTEILVCMFENGLSFGSVQEEIYAYTGFFGRVFDDMIVCELPGYQLILIPRRAVEKDGEWETLTSRLQAAKTKRPG